MGTDMDGRSAKERNLHGAASVAARSAGHIGAQLLDFLLPPQCLVCAAPTERQLALCPSCWTDLVFISAPSCERCGVPFELNIPGRSICAECHRRPPAYDQAISPLSYAGAGRALILKLKHGDRLDIARALGRISAPYVDKLGFENPILMPVPLHRWRLFRRRFNQSALLAQALGKINQLEVDVLTLIRRKATPMQQGLSAQQRVKNVRGAFAIAPKRKKRLMHRDVILVDDVYTTGATVQACTKVLRKAGARRIGVFTLARVADPQMPQ